MNRVVRTSSFLVALAFCGALAPAAWAKAIDLRKHDEAKLRGTKEQRWINRVVPAGDVNADGEPDLIVSGYDRHLHGIIRVFFGPVPRGTTSLEDTPRRGFSIYGPGGEDYASAGDAGDVNGDGLDDVVVGAPGADEGWGRAYVVFGKREPGDVDLADFDTGVQGTPTTPR